MFSVGFQNAILNINKKETNNSENTGDKLGTKKNIPIQEFFENEHYFVFKP
jgi:hypothetical protein